MRQYYYVIASLPFLQLDYAPPMEIEDLYYSCRNNINDEDLALLQSVDLEPGDSLGNEFLEKWYSWESSLRNELVQLRAQKQGIEVERYRREGEFIPGTPEIAKTAFSQDSPLTAEENLDQARWNKLDEFEVGHDFDLVKLLIYSLKLQLLQRRSRFTHELGSQKFGEIYEHVREDIQNAE